MKELWFCLSLKGTNSNSCLRVYSVLITVDKKSNKYFSILYVDVEEPS